MKNISYDEEIVEKAHNLFPKELFEPEFQVQIRKIYLTIMKGISFVCAPVRRLQNKKWKFIYRYILEKGDEYRLQFSDPELYGIIEVVPAKEPELKLFSEILESLKPNVGDSNIMVVTGINPTSPKFFRRKIRFISLNDYLSLLNFLFKSEYEDKRGIKKIDKKRRNFSKRVDLKRAAFIEFAETVAILKAAHDLIFSRQPKDSLLVIEDNKISQYPTVLNPGSPQFQKLINFSRKLEEMLTEVAGPKNKMIN